MGSNSSKYGLEKKEIDDISRETGFRSKQVKGLYERFTELDRRKNGYLTRAEFLARPELKLNPLIDRILDVVLEDFGDSSRISFRQFVMVMGIFRRNLGNDEPVLNTRENREKFLFSVYDRDKDGLISRAELLSILNILVGKSLPEEHITAIVERTMAELNLVEQEIDFATFKDTLKKIDIVERMSIKIQ